MWNNGMHPTRDTTALMLLYRAGGRVMPGGRCLAVCLDERYTENFDPGANFSRNYSF